MTAAVLDRTGFLIDTNVLSEATKPRPDPGLMEWLHAVDEDELFLSVISIGEIRRGVERLPESKRRARLTEWLSELVTARFNDRLLPVDLPVAQAWGRLRARADAIGQNVCPMDGLIAATAESHGLAVVTRNGKDFRALGVSSINPWEA
ncbi:MULTISPECIES: type II toxin-antitoxin system VapC family toxin [unclassified Nocardia]|uniref:type II toxin-antitoxin system VapC family toxin n=1 Tax=unclassified Nocardia TaxID=2637762 RepID=UPI001CE3D8AE|nr:MULTISPECIES: type II toxin-antitoxin system VapC family toxin [unclassified Nocardia]